MVDLIERSSKKVAKAIASSRSSRRQAHTQKLEQVSEEANELRRTLLKTYAGARLRQTFDWALSTGGDDDVSHYISKLTEMEQRLFYRGSSAVSAYQQWSLFGNRRLITRTQKSVVSATPGPAQGRAVITPGENAEENDRDSKRRRVQ